LNGKITRFREKSMYILGILNAILGVRVGELFQFPHSVEYSCVAGFRLIGPAKRKCTSKGDWTAEAPTCKRIMTFGHYFYTSSSFLKLSNAIVLQTLSMGP
jgi:hypothetical protein